MLKANIMFLVKQVDKVLF